MERVFGKGDVIFDKGDESSSGVCCSVFSQCGVIGDSVCF